MEISSLKCTAEIYLIIYDICNLNKCLIAHFKALASLKAKLPAEYYINSFYKSGD